MHDLRQLLNNRDSIAPKLQRRGEDTAYLDTLAKLSTERNQIVQKLDDLRAQRNEVSRAIGAAKRPPPPPNANRCANWEKRLNNLKNASGNW